MKRLIVAAMCALTVTAVNATEVGRYKNASGGEIVLTADACQMETVIPDAMALKSFDASGNVVFGCWTIDGKEVLAQFQDNDFRMYPVNRLIPSKEFQKFLDGTKNSPKSGSKYSM